MESALSLHTIGNQLGTESPRFCTLILSRTGKWKWARVLLGQPLGSMYVNVGMVDD